MVIVGLVLAVMLPILLGLWGTKREESTKTRLLGAKAALDSFIYSWGRLPCADSDLDGKEDCTEDGRYLPYGDIKVERRGAFDLFGLPVTYVVSNDLTQTTPQSVCSVLQTLMNDPSATPRVSLDGGNTFHGVPFLVLSAGRDKELSSENGDGDGDFVAQAGDDIVVWESYETLFQSLNCREQLPIGAYQVYNTNSGNKRFYVRNGMYQTCTEVVKDSYFIVGSGAYDNVNVYNNQNCSNFICSVTLNMCQSTDSDGDGLLQLTTQGNKCNLLDY